MPKRYAREFRRSVCERLVAGEKVSSIGDPFQLGLSYVLTHPSATDCPMS
jgi:hypothetical protein